MNKKNKNINNTWIVVGIVVAAFVIYYVSSYSGLLGSKAFTGSDNTVATKLSCVWSADNTVEATLTVTGSSSNIAALAPGSALQAETIAWDVSGGLGTIAPSTSVTDAEGIARGTFRPAPGTVPSLSASFAGDRIQVDYRDNADNAEVNTVIVEYSASSCEMPSVDR